MVLKFKLKYEEDDEVVEQKIVWKGLGFYAVEDDKLVNPFYSIPSDVVHDFAESLLSTGADYIIKRTPKGTKYQIKEEAW